MNRTTTAGADAQMREKTGKDDENDEDDDRPGFLIRLPFGLGWLRGDGEHLMILIPMIRWLVVVSTMAYLGIRIWQETTK